MRNCKYCGSELKTRKQIKFCSIKCQTDDRYDKYIRSWKQGKETGNRGIVAKGISGHLKRYLLDKYSNECSKCGWNKKHPITGNFPLEVDHIDGNSENNHEKNLRLLCPNCHALTPFFKNLNKGKGRSWRMNKYIKNI